MAVNRVSVIITGEDRLSASISGIMSKFDGMGIRAGAVAGLVGGATTAAISGMISLAQTATGAFASAIQGARALQTQALSGANALSTLSDLSFERASVVYDELTRQLASDAVKMPGTVSQYLQVASSLQDDVVNILSEAGQFSEKTYKELTSSIAKSGGVLASFGGFDVQWASAGLQAALAGRSISQLRKLDLFQKYQPGLLSQFERAATELYQKGFEELAAPERLRVIEKALNNAIDPKALAKFQNSAQGVFDAWFSGLFDPLQGVFGLSRDLSAAAGNQMVFASLQRVVVKLLGSDGVLARVGRIFDTLGLDVDPMVALADGIGKFGKFLDDTNRVWGGSILF